MLESGAAFALVTAMVFAYYRTENINKKRIVAAVAVVLGFLSGVVSAVLRSIPNFLNRTHFSFYSVIPIVVSMLFLLLLIATSKKWKPGKLENLMTAGVTVYVISSHFYYLPSVLLQSNSFVYYGESAISTMVLYRVLGFVFGIMAMVISASVLYSTASKLQRTQLSAITAVSMILMGITQVNVIVQRMYSLKLIPKNKFVFRGIAFISNQANFFYFLMILFLAIVPLLMILRNLRLRGSYPNPAQLRKAKYHMRHKRRLAGFLIVCLAFHIFSMTYVKSYAYRDVPLSPPEHYETEEGAVVLPLEIFEDGLLHRYEYKSRSGIPVRFIVIKKSGGSYGVCLDACEICGPSGYFMRKDEVICKLCDVVMNKGTIGFKGGCNPIPIPFLVHDRKIKILLEELEKSEDIFK